MSLHIFAATLAFLLFFRVLGGLAHHKAIEFLVSAQRQTGVRRSSIFLSLQYTDEKVDITIESSGDSADAAGSVHREAG